MRAHLQRRCRRLYAFARAPLSSLRRSRRPRVVGRCSSTARPSSHPSTTPSPPSRPTHRARSASSSAPLRLTSSSVCLHAVRPLPPAAARCRPLPPAVPLSSHSVCVRVRVRRSSRARARRPAQVLHSRRPRGRLRVARLRREGRRRCAAARAASRVLQRQAGACFARPQQLRPLGRGHAARGSGCGAHCAPKVSTCDAPRARAERGVRAVPFFFSCVNPFPPTRWPIGDRIALGRCAAS
jgi:hypothetical protein